MKGLGLFEGYGVELEYMIVDARSLDVAPLADRVLAAEAGEVTGEVVAGPLRWSNELVLHVIELKTDGPARSLEGLAGRFQEGVAAVNAHLESLGGMLMPGGMHPWMDPQRETRLWPYENSSIYLGYDRIFGCQGHGWANLQSAHINLPFAGDDEFARLHAAIRLLLPILPALAASSPVVDGRLTGLLDSRLAVYRHNQRKVPEVAGQVIPEACFSRREYEEQILQPMYRAIAPHDPDGTLQEEWLNSRGAIARFERDTIEIRLLDVQECPAADLAIARVTAAALAALAGGRWQSPEEQQRWPVAPLAEILEGCIRHGEHAPVTDRAYLAALGFPETWGTAGELWRHLAGELGLAGDGVLRTLLDEGPLARRLGRALGAAPGRVRLTAVYRELCACLARGELFHG